MRKLLIFLLIISNILSTTSCRKDKLSGDKSILEGKWRWVFTNEGVNATNHWSNKNPQTEGKNYSVELLSCGKIKYFENGKEIDKKRIVIAEFKSELHPNKAPAWYFVIDLNNRKNNSLQGYLYDRNSDTLFLYGESGFPFSGLDYYGSWYTEHVNYFVREN